MTFLKYFVGSVLGRIALLLVAIALIGWLKAMAMFDDANLVTAQQPEGNLAEALAATYGFVIPSLILGVVGIGFGITAILRFRR